MFIESDLSEQQYAGTACVGCAHILTDADNCVSVGNVGRDQHDVYACPECAPSSPYRLMGWI
jgi:hypothetical protein